MNGTPHSRHLVQNLGIYFDPFLGSSKGPPSSIYSTFQISQSVLPSPSLLVLAHHPAPGSSSSLLAGLPTPTLPLPSCPIQCQSGLPTATEPQRIPAHNLSELSAEFKCKRFGLPSKAPWQQHFFLNLISSYLSTSTPRYCIFWPYILLSFPHVAFIVSLLNLQAHSFFCQDSPPATSRQISESLSCARHCVMRWG